MNRVNLRKSIGRATPLLVLAALALPAQAQEPLHGTVEVLYTNADGSFRSPVRWVVGDHARTVAAEDFTGDTHQDVLVAYETLDGVLGRSHVGLMENSGNGTLTLGWNGTVGEPAQLVVGIETGDWYDQTGETPDGLADFRVYLALSPAPDPSDVVRHGYSGDGSGSFTYMGETAGSAPPVPPFPPHPLLVDLSGDTLADKVYANRRAEDLTNLPVALGNGPADIDAPDAFAVPPGGNFDATVPVRLRPNHPGEGGTMTVCYTLDGTDPAPGAPGTWEIAAPFDDTLYLYKTTTVKFMAQFGVGIDLFEGPTHTEVYAIGQPITVDTDSDGIPDLYEIGDDGRARPGFHPLLPNHDSDGDGDTDLTELLQGTDPFSMTCEGGDQNGEICFGGEDCPGGVCTLRCAYGPDEGLACSNDSHCVDAPCGDGEPTNPAGAYVLDGTTATGSGVFITEVRTLDVKGSELSESPVYHEPGGAYFGLRTPSGFDTLCATPDLAAGGDEDPLMVRLIPRLLLPAVEPAEGWDTAAEWLAAAQTAYATDQFRSGADLNPHWSGMAALAGYEASERLAEPGTIPEPWGGVFGRSGSGINDRDLDELLRVTDLATHAYLLNFASAGEDLDLFDAYTLFSEALLATVYETGDTAITPSEVVLNGHLRDGTVPAELQPGMAARGYDTGTILAIADLARAESGALAGAVQGAVQMDAPQRVEDAAAGSEGKFLAAVRQRHDLVVWTADEAAGDLVGLGHVEAAGRAMAMACYHAYHMEDGGVPASLDWWPAGALPHPDSSVICGAGVLYEALSLAASIPEEIDDLTSRMDDLIFDIIAADCDPTSLASLSSAVADYLEPDTTAPVTTADPVGGLYATFPLVVHLESDEPATVYVRIDGSDPVPGEPGVFEFDTSADLNLVADAALRFFAVDSDGNAETVHGEAYHLDRDGDGVPDQTDNCTYVANPGQQDDDGDGIGNACDNQDCGNGVEEPGEPCDDGNQTSGDGCSADCQIETRIDLASESADLTVLGPVDDARLGYTIAAGELTGDGEPDVAIRSGAGPQGVHVLSDPAFSPGAVRDLATEPAEIILSDPASSWCGSPLVIGDVNDDGQTDLVLGCSRWDNDAASGLKTEAGAVFVFLGPLPPGSTEIGMANAAVSIFGERDGDHLPSRAALGDWDGDGNVDLLVGAPHADVAGRTDAGRAMLFRLDPSSFPQTWNLADGATPDLEIIGNAGDQLGRGVALGDVDGNGTDEIAVGAPATAPGGLAGAGATYLAPDGPASSWSVIDVFDQLDRVAVFRGTDPDGALGYRVRLADADDDGLDDLAISAFKAAGTGGITLAGKLYLNRDPALYVPGTGTDVTDGVLDLTVIAEVPDARAGMDMELADLDGDRRGEIVAGAPYGNHGTVPGAGRVFAIPTDQPDSVIDLATESERLLVEIWGGEASGQFGRHIAAADADGDGLADILAGAPVAGTNLRGKAYVFLTPPADSDHDGLPNHQDSCPDLPLLPDAGYDGHEDADGDGRGDGCDNCPLDPNPDQRDGDDDGAGDACDPDPVGSPIGSCDGIWDVLDGYADSDYDGWGDPCDCRPSIPTSFPGAPETCDGTDSDCDGALMSDESDRDLDSWAPCQGDCDDLDPDRNPGQVEICNRIDDDCDGALPAAEQDNDSDGYAPCEGDCNDLLADVHPGALELCRNHVDDNCDSLTDAQDPACSAFACVVVTLRPMPMSDPRIHFEPEASCPLELLPRDVDVIWGELANLTLYVDQIDLGPVLSVACGSGFRGHRFDSLRPDPGQPDFILVRETGAPHYGTSSGGTDRVAGSGDCP